MDLKQDKIFLSGYDKIAMFIEKFINITRITLALLVLVFLIKDIVL